MAHKDLFPNIDGIEIIAIIILFSFSIITTIAGIGGGVIFLPILMIMFGFDTQEAAPISITMVFCVLLVRNLLSFSQRHPLRDKPIINYDIALIFSPANIIGNIFGVVINKVSPSWLILVFIIILMSVNAFFTGQKAIELRKKTKKSESYQNIQVNLTNEAQNYLEKLKNYRDSANTSDITNKLLDEKEDNNNNISHDLIEINANNFISYHLDLDHNSISIIMVDETKRKLEKILRKEKRLVDYEKIIYLFLNITLLIVLNLFRGNDRMESILNFDYCGVWFWVFQFLYIPFGLMFLYFAIKKIISETQEKFKVGYVFRKNDLKWDKKTCIQLSLNGLLVGIISSLLGVGGAIISAPLLLKLGVETQEASYTASFMALFSSIVSMIEYLIDGKIKWDYAGFCAGVCVIAMIIGLKGVLEWLKKNNKLYIIVFALVFMIFVSTILNIYSNVYELITDEDSREFHEFC